MISAEQVARQAPRETYGEPLSYDDFLRAKLQFSKNYGFEIEDSDIHPWVRPHARLAIRWAVRGGRRGLFESFGLHKTSQQLEILRIITERVGGRGLIVAPLGVRQEFKRDAGMLGIDIRFVRRIEECDETGLYLTNYETIRDGKMDPALFMATSLDEASILRGFGGNKTFREFMRLFESVKYRFVATATPDPNEFIELLAYAAYLGIMDVSAAKTRFFKRDSVHADRLTLHPHRADEFWGWCASWGLFLKRPSDLNCSDEGYALPEMDVVYHEVKSDQSSAVSDEKGGQMRMIRSGSVGVSDAAHEKRASLATRIEEMKRIIAESPDDHFIIWHDLEDERRAIEQAVPGVVTVYGSQDQEVNEKALTDFADGKIQHLGLKPDMSGSGGNFQRHCHKAIFLGIGFKFNSFIQALHRVQRFGQTRRVEAHLIYSESERPVLKRLQEKWERHTAQSETMSALIKEHGLSDLALAQALTRSLGVERVEVAGDNYRVVNNDAVLETRRIESNSVGLVLTSIPFAAQYEYSPSYNDFGHTESPEHFFEQMDYLTPELLRVLQPGRIAAVHVKDRVVPGGLNGFGVQSIYYFHVDVIKHFEKHGFLSLGMKTIVTDVVRENKQTYRLGWSEQCKDGSKMGYGLPEYLLLFRKPQSDRTKGYADIRVKKSKARYSKSRWQADAHGFTRSSGNRMLTPEEIRDQPHQKIFGMFHDFYLNNVYDFEHVVKLGEALEQRGRLPSTFMLLQPPSWHPDVWTDITRMLTANASQAQKGRVKHLCPMQYDLADRVITQMSNEGDVVFDPFGGLMTVPARAVALRRRGLGIELNNGYFLDGAAYCEAAEREISTPTLFDLMAAELPEEMSA